MMISRNNLFLVLYALGAAMMLITTNDVGGVYGMESNETETGQFDGTTPGGETNQTLGSDYEQDQTEPESFLFGTDDENFVKSEGKDIGVMSGGVVGYPSSFVATTTATAAATVVASAIAAAVFAL